MVPRTSPSLTEKREQWEDTSRMSALRLAPLRGAILVGGESRRFGAPKQLAPLGGSTFGARVAATLASACGAPLVVGSGPLPPELEALPRAPDAPGLRGPIAGLLGALAAAPGEALLVVACDQPLISLEALEWLAAQRRRGAIAVVARLGARGIEPLPALYEPEARTILEALAATGGSLQPLGRRSDVVVVSPPAALAAAWTSVDTEEHRRELEATLSS
jgi:molybdopterin-guanine dinucleotide biosynthesis protein A